MSKTLPEREAKAVNELADLTGWSQETIRSEWKRARDQGRDETPKHGWE